MPKTRHIVLVTYGEPQTPGFVEQLVYSWRILVGLTRTVAPIPLPLLPAIALARARGRTRAWNDARYQSPLEPITVRQAGLLQDALDGANGGPFAVHVAYEFRRPLVSDALAAIPADEDVWIVPMYAADSAFTHALSRTAAAAHAAGAGPARRTVQVLGPLDLEVLAAASADHVLEAIGATGAWSGRDVALVLAAHGTVLNPPTPIDTGLAATDALCQAIAGRLRPHFGLVVNGWLNHTRGGKWTEPPIEQALAQVTSQGYGRVVYYPYGFLADNAESELEGRVALAQHESIESLHIQCLNDSARLVNALAQQITRAA